MTDNGDCISATSSLEDLRILDPDDYKELSDTTPAVAFIDDDLLQIQPLFDNEEEDLSAYVKDQTGDNNQSPSSDELLNVGSSYSDSLSPESVSSSNILSPFISLSYDIDFPDWLEAAEDVDLHPQWGHRDLSKTVDDRWNLLYSSSLKEELRCRIQLKRITSGQEELKVDFTAPSTTLCYDSVKKRNEVREKNKEYAKQSRDRVKNERTHVEQIHQRLRESNEKLKKDILNMKEMMKKTYDLLHHHHKECSLCPQAENACSICPKEITGRFTGFKRSLEQERPRCFLKQTNKPRDFSPPPSRSCLSKVGNCASSSEMATKSGDATFWSDEHEAQIDKHPHKLGAGKTRYLLKQANAVRGFSPQLGPVRLSKVAISVSSSEMATKSGDTTVLSDDDEAQIDKYPHKEGIGNTVCGCTSSKFKRYKCSPFSRVRTFVSKHKM